MSRVRRGEAFWQELVSQWRACGMPLAPFARSRGVAVNTLAYWVRRDAAPPVRLVRVDVEAPLAPPVSGVEVALLGAVVRVGRDVPAAWVADLLRAAGS